MDKIIRNVNEQLWRKAKARAAFEAITLKQLVEEGLSLRLGYITKSPANHLKKHLPSKAYCADCGNEVLKKGKAEKRMILHHIVPKDQGGTDDPSNRVILCPSCHKLRHERAMPKDAVLGFTKRWLECPEHGWGWAYPEDDKWICSKCRKEGKLTELS